ncbi:MAG TPA: fibrillarin-like rRNA/tRNA 2'-O-methyltransferase [Methanomassiliicoccales archaeon]|nr:fibrillarin-like rRNA/tRNA 2'-O-methyltransferase [Methanomassiliicoccales archaeon]
MAEDVLTPLWAKGVFTDGERLYTRNSAPGTRVYGERLVEASGIEYRQWDHRRSKLAAYLKLGGKHFPFTETSRVLYLGAASGTTASHVADVCVNGTVFCIEFSPRSFRELVTVCEQRKNMVPILADATRPAEYKFVVETAEIVYQDVAQKNQAQILAKNMREFSARHGLLALKARSEDVTLEPSTVFRNARSSLEMSKLKVDEVFALDPYEKDHAMLVVGA